VIPASPQSAGWEAQLTRLVAYKVAHGDCNVPEGWAVGRTAEDLQLGSWVHWQRVGKRKLDRGEPSRGMTVGRAARLEALGFAWAPVGAARGWEPQLARLVAYKAVHGDCNVPEGWAKDPQLGTWADTQRVGKRKLDRGEPSRGMTAERAAILEALGFAWAPGPKPVGAALPDEGAWEAQLARLAAYKAEHGDCNVPARWAEDPRLGSWVVMQRHLKRRLDRGEPSGGMTAERAARLTALGVAWEGTKAHGNEFEWEEKLTRLAAYKVAHGDCDVPQGWAEDPRLSKWVDNQRAYKKKLDRGEPSYGMTAARAARMEALGFAWAPSQKAAWEAQFARLVAYKTTHGACSVPRRWEDSRLGKKGWAVDSRLAGWITRQRAHKRKLDRGEPSDEWTAECEARLTALGFVWDQKEAEWEAQLARLTAYKAEHGDCDVPWDWAGDPYLSSWLHQQRHCKQKLDRGELSVSSGEMTAERAARLTALGFAWDIVPIA
jgi:hypothetical protein